MSSTLPPVKESFAIEISKASINHLNDISDSTQKMFMIPVSSILVKEDFNVRNKNQSYEDHIESLKESMLEEGFHPYEPLGVWVEGKDEDIKIFVFHGHSRLEAVKRAIKEGARIDAVPCVPLPRGTNREELTAQLISGNNGRKLTSIEKSVVVARLKKWNCTYQEIKKLTGVDIKTISKMLSVQEAPLAFQKMIAEEKITFSMACDLIELYGTSKCLDAANKMLSKSEKEGKKKVSVVHDSQLKLRKILQKKASDMIRVVSDVSIDPAFDMLQQDTRSNIQKLMDLIEEATKEDQIDEQVEEPQKIAA